jgi:hypothetical protein
LVARLTSAGMRATFLICFARISTQAIIFTIFCLASALAQAPPPAGFPGVAPAGPPAEILRFEVAPAAIRPGETATLRWEALNTYSLQIDGLGSVATRGSRAVTPTTTTTYTLTATGAGGVKTAAATVTIAGTTPAGAPTGAAPNAQAVPRLWTGEPDLSGVYLGGRDVRLTGQVVLKAGAESFRVPPRDDDLGQGAQCLPPGVPGATLSPFPLQIVHRPELLVILYEAYNIFRIIPIGREHGEDLDPSWLGHSTGRWEGDTLVVEVLGFNDKTLVAGHRHTEALRVIERYRRTAYDAIAYEATVEDPNVFAAPVRYAGTLALHPEWEIGEYICAENNKSYSELFE